MSRPHRDPETLAGRFDQLKMTEFVAGLAPGRPR
jgi:hypothetical protein